MKDFIEVINRNDMVMAGSISFNEVDASELHIGEWAKGEMDRFKVAAALKVYDWFLGSARSEAETKDQLKMEEEWLENNSQLPRMPCGKVQRMMQIMGHRTAIKELKWILDIND
jgi:hypothetical protein